MKRLTVALVAHDATKAALVDWVAEQEGLLAAHRLVATGTTGARILERCDRLQVERLKSGPYGGDQQLGAKIAEGRLDVLIFFVDPMTPMPHDVDVKALTRLSVLYDIPTAFNRATADCLIASVLFGAPEHGMERAP